MLLLILTTTILFGLFSSYFGVVAERGWKASIQGRSQCDKCGRQLALFEMLPVLSWVINRIDKNGFSKCCNQKVSLKYLIIEILGVASGFLLGTVLSFHLNQVELATQGLAVITELVLITLLAFIWLYIAIEDIWHYSIPLFGSIAVLVVSIVIATLQNGFTSALLPNLIVGIVFAIATTFLVLTTRQKAMGLGDILLFAALGVSLGWPLGLVGLEITILTAAVVGIALAFIKRKFRGLLVPLVPFIFLGWLGALVFGQQVLTLLYLK